MRLKIWQKATQLAEQTPASRNRYVDFLRAASVIVVITGHWLVVAPYLDGSELVLPDILSISPRTQWLTWIVQIMPIFFIYSSPRSLCATNKFGPRALRNIPNYGNLYWEPSCSATAWRC